MTKELTLHPHAIVMCYSSVTQALYEFVFAQSAIDGPFGIYHTFPRRLVSITGSTIEAEQLLGTVAKEEDESSPDPLTYIDDTDFPVPPSEVMLLCVVAWQLVCKEYMKKCS